MSRNDCDSAALERIEALARTCDAGAEKLTSRADLAIKFGFGLALKRHIAADRKDARLMSFFAAQIRAAIQEPEGSSLTLSKGITR